jgi:hypothetical protein
MSHVSPSGWAGRGMITVDGVEAAGLIAAKTSQFNSGAHLSWS